MEQTDRQTDSPVLAVALSARLSRVTLLWNRQTDRQTDRDSPVLAALSARLSRVTLPWKLLALVTLTRSRDDPSVE